MSLTSIVVVNWNTAGLIGPCIDAVRRHTLDPYEIVLVDNGSEDESVHVMRSLEDSKTRIVTLERNLGYAAGNNRGVEASRGDTICLLNTDALVTRGWLSRMLRCRARTGAGLVGPYTSRCKGRQRRRLLFNRWPKPPRPTRNVEFLSFYCVLIGREVFDRIGLLDERFGYGTYEDADFCRRAVEAGFDLRIAGHTWVWHEGNATFQANNLDKKEIREVNSVLFEKKWDEDDLTGPDRVEDIKRELASESRTGCPGSTSNN